MSHIVTTVADSRITDLLMRLDAATALLMAMLSAHFFWIAWKERDHGPWDRPLQGIFIIACLTAWMALDLFWISMSRAALINGATSAQFVSSPVRLVVPGVGLFLAVFTVLWSSEVRPWQVLVGLAAAAATLFWPEPYELLALTVYTWLT